MVSLIELKRKLEYSNEDSLLSLEGRLEKYTNKMKAIRFEKTTKLQWTGQFQVNRKLYLSGANQYRGVATNVFAKFSSLDYSGKMTELQPMQQPRTDVTLSGVPSHLIALGGWKG